LRSVKDMLVRMFLGRRALDWPGLEGRSASRLPSRERDRDRPEGGVREDREAGAAGVDGGEAAQGELPPLRPDWRDIVAFTIAMYQILAVPFLLFCGVALFIYLLLWLWAR